MKSSPVSKTQYLTEIPIESGRTETPYPVLASQKGLDHYITSLWLNPSQMYIYLTHISRLDLYTLLWISYWQTFFFSIIRNQVCRFFRFLYRHMCGSMRAIVMLILFRFFVKIFQGLIHLLLCLSPCVY